MSDVRMPDGTIIRNVPDGVTRSQLLEKLGKLEQPKEKDNFFERFGNDLKQRFGVQGAEIINRRVKEDQGFVSTALQLTGKVGAGSIMDFLGEALVSGGRGLKTITSNTSLSLPLATAGEKATQAGMALMNTELGQKGLEAAKDGVVSYMKFKEENPVMAANIEAVTNIALLVAPVKAKPAETQAGALTKAATRLERSAAKSTKQHRQAFVKRLITPEQTKKVRTEQARPTRSGPRTSDPQGPLRSQVVELTKYQKLVAQEVSKIPGVKPNKTIQANLNAIGAEVSREAARLEKGLASMNKPHLRARPGQKPKVVGNKGKYLQREFEDAIDQMAMKLAHPSVQGDAAKATADMLAGMKRIAAENPQTLSGLLKSRREFDQWITQGKGANFFKSDVHNALQTGVRATRQAVNDFIAVRAPSKGVRKSLDKQSRLMSAIDDIAVKAASEEHNMLSRAFKNALKLLPFRGEFNQLMAAVFGVGGLGASARFAPWFTKIVGATGVVYVGSKAVTRPHSRKGLAGLLKMIDEAAQKTTDPAVLRQFRLDRAAIVELMKTSVEAAEED